MEPTDTLQHLPEHLPRHSHLSELEHQPPGVADIRRAARSGLLVVIDEIGKMELCSWAFRHAVLEALDWAPKVLGTILMAPHPWADQVKRDPRVRLVEPTQENRSAVLPQVLGRLSALA